MAGGAFRYPSSPPVRGRRHGRVYLAHDCKLGRKVALKLVLDQYAGSPERLQRFAREARAASALNHPNIVTVYDVDVDGDTRFIATEFVEGETLRTRLQRGRISLAEALRIATQVADALAAAHRGSIVHRDIKPENILLRPDGYVKIVDFGLAKLAERAADQERLETRTAMETSVGVVVGTVAYMSPEQARGLPVDARTDVWSLGVVLYEMITGRRPFEGRTSSDVIAMILQRDPPPLETIAPEAAGEVALVVETALARDADDRCQSARDLVNVLRRVQRHIDGDDSGTSRTRTSALITRHKSALGTALAVALILAAVGAYRGYGHRLRDRGGELAQAFEHFQIARLTSSNRVLDATISPDGRYVVHSVDDGPGQSLRVRHVNTSSNVEIVPSADVAYIGMTFSRDGDYVYYVSRQLSGGVASLYRIAVLGGAPSKVIEDVDTSITFSPDGTRFAFIRGYEDGSTSVIVADADGTRERRLATLQPPRGFATGHTEPIGPAWSPDGKTIASPIEGAEGDHRHNPIGIIDVNSGTVTTLGSWYMVRRLTWLADNAGLVAAAADKSSAYSAQQIWHIPFPSGEPRPITRDLSNYGGVSMTAAGRAFLAVQTSTTSEIWVAPRQDLSAASIVTPSRTTFDGRFGLGWTPSGQIVYSSAANATFDLWTMNADGSGRRPISTEAGADLYPDVSRDGKTVVMSSDRVSNILEVWRMAIDGTGAKRLTHFGSIALAKILPDGSIFFSSGYTTWRVSPDGGTPARVTTDFIYRPSLSADGTRFVCSYRETATAPARLAVYQIGEHTPRQFFDIPATADTQAHWSPDGRSLHYIDTRDGVSNIWSLSLNGGPATQVTRFKNDRIFAFAWSRDGSKLALSRGSVASDAVLITSER